MIIGRDLIRSLDIDIHGVDMTIQWDDAAIPWLDIYSTAKDVFALSQHNTPFNAGSFIKSFGVGIAFVFRDSFMCPTSFLDNLKPL